MMNIMKHIRTNPAIIAYALYLYFNSRSYRFAYKSRANYKKNTIYLVYNSKEIFQTKILKQNNISGSAADNKRLTNADEFADDEGFHNLDAYHK